MKVKKKQSKFISVKYTQIQSKSKPNTNYAENETAKSKDIPSQQYKSRAESLKSTALT